LPVIVYPAALGLLMLVSLSSTAQTVGMFLLEDVKHAVNIQLRTSAPTAALWVLRGVKMGEVMVTFKVLPADSDTDINVLKRSASESIKELCSLDNLAVVDIGYGLKALKLTIRVADEEGKIGVIEDKLGSLPEVGQVDTEEVTLA